MPNWCQNYLEIQSSPDIIEMFTHEAETTTGLFNSILPMPFNSTLDRVDWNRNNWGTKWDISAGDISVCSSFETSLIIMFDTPWSPPDIVYSYLNTHLINILAHYYEAGMCFCGTYGGGVNYCKDFACFSDVPSDIADVFSIDESHFEWSSEE